MVTFLGGRDKSKIAEDTNPVPVNISDSITGKNVRVESNGGLAVNIQDQTTEIIDVYLNQKIDDITLNVATALGDRTINISSNTLPVVGNYICLKDVDGQAFYQGEILAVGGANPYVLTLDRPLDFTFSTSDGCSLNTVDMNIDGSVTPQIFKISPGGLASSVRWDINRIIFRILDDLSMDDGKFGGIPKLTNGIVLRKVDGTWKNIFNVKSNGEFAERAYDTFYADRAPAGQYGFRCRRTFNGQDKNGVTIRLQSDDSDELQIIIQDNLTGLSAFRCVVQGHVVGD